MEPHAKCVSHCFRGQGQAASSSPVTVFSFILKFHFGTKLAAILADDLDTVEEGCGEASLRSL